MINMICKIFVISAVLIQSFCFSYGQTANDEIESMKAEIKRLTAENAKLKYENQQLRKMLGQPENKTVPTVPAGGQIFKTNTESSVTSSDQQETGYWMTISSGKRHNKTCRYYKGSKGRFCKPDEGVACKICGG